MAPLIIEGRTLGQKHRSYNKIVNDAIKSKLYQEVADINYEESDLENLFKIDIACHNRNVEYVLKVLKCEDMLYISRAVKRSTWLITDPQYAHIINPTYLFNELFPHMTSKAINKFILHIRLNLKDEIRVEKFFNYYYKQEDLRTAFKWLPHCSITFTENIIKEYANRIPDQLVARLCERSISFLEIFFRYSNYESDIFLSTKCLFKNNADKYLDIMEDNFSDKTYIAEYFTPKLTKSIMTKCCDRIIKNFELYADYLHIPTLAKYIKKEESRDFFLKYKKNQALQPFFAISQVQPLINRLPLENRIELVKEIFIYEKYKKESIDESSNRIIYSWYAYAPFCTAFDQFKRLIQKETTPKERLIMFKVLLSSAKHNLQDIYTLLKYYRENHIKEPFKFKVEFVNLVLTTTKAHTFDKEAWGYLNDLFISMDVYSECGDQDVQTCIKSIILYKVIQNEVVPGIIEKKFVFDTCKEYQKKLTQEENKKVFSYLFKYITSKIEQDIKDQEKFTETGDVLEHILYLLLDWKRELQDFPYIIQKIKEIINLKRVKSWDYDITKLYNIKKSWKKLFFAESILLNPNQEAFINALKHGPEVLEKYKTEVEIICLSDNLHAFLKKIRIYWPNSLANYYKTLFLNNLNQITKHKYLIIGLCALLSQGEFLRLVNKYVPTQKKIDWTQHDEIELSLRKQIATRLHLARPQPSFAIALSYAKGDYVQYVLPSLNAILYNMSCSYTSEIIKQLLDAPVSLQKHGIRISSRKLNKKQLMQLYSDIWKLNKNSSIRSVLFCKTFDILSKEKDTETINIIWKSLSMFIDSLTSKENKNIYKKLIEFSDVPACVRGEFWVKSNKFLKSNKSNPKIKNLDYLTCCLWVATPDDILEDHIIREIFLESLDNRLSTGNYQDPTTLTEYILVCKSEEIQIRRHNKVLVPVLERCFALWDTKHKTKYCVRTFFHNLCKRFCTYYTTLLFNEGICPSTVITDIFNRIECNLPMPENYVLLLRFKLANIFYKILSTKEEQIKGIKETIKGDPYASWQRLNEAAAQEIGRECVKHLRKDVKSVFPTVYNIYSRVLLFLCKHSYFDITNVSLLLKTILEAKDLVEGHLLVLQAMKIKRSRYDELIEFESLQKELLDEIQKHPSDEVKYHYCQYWYDNIGRNFEY